MGNDGGSIPKRRELVKEAARLQTASEAKESQQEQQEDRWSTCPLSHTPLKAPVVSDSAGNLYNKDAMIEYLIPSDDPSEAAIKADKDKVLGGRVKSLKDVVEVKFQTEEAQGDTQKWVCPITSKVLGAGVKSVYLVPCGHAFSEVALKEVAETKCLQCGEAYTPDNVIPILPLVPAEKERLVKRVEALKEQGLAHSLKKASGSGKKRKKQAAEGEQPVKNGEKAANGSRSNGTSNSGIKNAATASLTAKVLAEEQEKAKRRKLDRNDNLKSLFSSGPKGPQKDGDFMTRGHSVAADMKR